MVCGFTAVPVSGAAPAAKFELSMANTQPATDIETMAMYECAKVIEEKTNGGIVSTVYPNSELGDTDDLVEQAAQGMNVMVPTDPLRLADYIPDFAILMMPYLFTDMSALDKYIQTPSYKAWEEEFLKHDIKVLASNWYGGARHFVLNKVIDTPADLRGIKVRTMKTPITAAAINAMGAVATPMSQSEIYMAVEQKAIDGTENQDTSTYANRFYEILKVINKTGHFTLIGVCVVGTPFFNSLPSDYQKIMVDTFVKVGTDYQDIGLVEEARCEKEMEKLGVTIHQVNTAPFIEATLPIYKEFNFEELRARLMDEMAQVK
jgi:TRAP-type C4-dicarboxylate transport system substrate-binding protein